jgi:hypothetical protein
MEEKKYNSTKIDLTLDGGSGQFTLCRFTPSTRGKSPLYSLGRRLGWPHAVGKRKILHCRQLNPDILVCDPLLHQLSYSDSKGFK